MLHPHRDGEEWENRRAQRGSVLAELDDEISDLAQVNLDPRDGPVGRWGKNFIYTNQGILDNDVCSLLAVIAVAKLGHDDPEVDEPPRRIIDLANRLAGAGCPVVLKELSEDALRTTPLDRALQFASSLQERVRPNE